MLTEWENHVYPALLEMEDEVSEMLEPLKASILKDQERWPGSRSMTMPNTDLDYNVVYLKDYISDRTEFLYQAFSVNFQETEEQFRKRAAELPEEAMIEPYTEGEEDGGEGTELSGVKEYLLAGHGMISLLILIMVLGFLIAADRRRNG